jgi:phosphatidylglycerophosphate synthase
MNFNKIFHNTNVSRDTLFEILLNIFSKNLLRLIFNTSIKSNHVTIFGALIGFLGLTLYLLFQNNIVLTLFLIIYLVCDFLDGDLARARNSFSNLGSALDKYVDKFVLIFIIILIINFNIIPSNSFVLEKLILILFVLYFQILLVLNSHFEFKNITNESIKKNNKAFIFLNFYLRPTHINIIIYFLIFNWFDQVDFYIYIYGTISFALIIKQFLNLRKL